MRSKGKGFTKLLNLSGTLMNTRTWLSKKQGGGWHPESTESFKQVHKSQKGQSKGTGSWLAGVVGGEREEVGERGLSSDWEGLEFQARTPDFIW